jgi:hypothetical protein
MRVCEMRVGGEGWDFDIEARLAREPPSSFAQQAGGEQRAARSA